MLFPDTDGTDRNGLQLEKIRLKFSKIFKLVDIKSILNGHGLFSFNEIKLICSFNVQTQCWAWIKLATDNFSTVLTKNLWNTRDYTRAIRIQKENWGVTTHFSEIIDLNFRKKMRPYIPCILKLF